ncbi:recombinase family protein [Streptomyces anulatus]|uniref:recombinase family protein n=1 Tax=Streptomyces anulatus TaxID=1892 RepID=UPI0036AE71CD
MITKPQVSSAGNARRESTSVSGPADRYRHMLIGYARVSTAVQNPDHQIDALLRAGADRDHVDTASGAKASSPKLDLAMQLLREGDMLKVTRLDRLSRSVLHLVTLGADLRERGIGLHVIEQGIGTSTMEGRAMFGTLSVPAELQRELIVRTPTTGSPPHGHAAGSKDVGPSSPRIRPRSPKGFTTSGRRPSSKSPTCSAFPRSTVYGHLDKTKTVPRQPKKATGTKP